MRIRLTAAVVLVQTLLVMSVSEVSAACFNPSPASPQMIAQFKANPQALVATGADTRTIEATTRDLVGTDASLAAELVNVARGAMPRFQTAIAAGLAQAAIACGNVDQQAALLIQQAVASFEDGQFQGSFAAVAGDLSTAATEAANAFATSSFGSVVIVNPNSSPRATTNPGGGGSLTALQITTTGLAITSTTTSASTTAAEPVSATR
jgi:hypothetical protein